MRATDSYRGCTPSADLRSGCSIAGGQPDFKVVNLIPLGLRPLAVWYGKKLLQAILGRNPLRCSHVGIIPSLDKGGRTRPASGQQTAARQVRRLSGPINHASALRMVFPSFVRRGCTL